LLENKLELANDVKAPTGKESINQLV